MLTRISSSCGIPEFKADVDGAPACWTISWDTTVNPTAFDDLFAACTVPGREVDRLLVSSLPTAPGTCDPRVEALLAGAHALNIEVYMLYAASTESFPEQDFVLDVSCVRRVCHQLAICIIEYHTRFRPVMALNPYYHCPARLTPSVDRELQCQLSWRRF